MLTAKVLSGHSTTVFEVTQAYRASDGSVALDMPTGSSVTYGPRKSSSDANLLIYIMNNSGSTVATFEF